MKSVDRMTAWNLECARRRAHDTKEARLARQQALAARDGAEMPLQFIVDQGLPRDIRTITLSYTLFDVTDTVTDGLAAR